ncbi:hypothetical protein LXA43DRAFT_1089738 [Ganoderma leucocontextum]|nr:hypothetical protein LXA43DRAFT_1089738 [Ganoderma leucocontextum]
MPPDVQLVPTSPLSSLEILLNLAPLYYLVPPSSRSQFSRLIADGGGPLVHVATMVVGATAVVAGADDFDDFDDFQTVPPSAAPANNTFFSAATITSAIPTSFPPPLAVQSFSPSPAQAANNNLFDMFSTDTTPVPNMNVIRPMIVSRPQ